MTTQARPRLSKYGREIAPIAERCGYRFDRQAGGHYVFIQAGFPNFVVPSTPSDIRAFANDIARLKRLHPDQFERAKSANRPTKGQRRSRAKSRLSRTPIALLQQPASTAAAEAPIVVAYPPGSAEAIAAGCICPPYENNHGVGIDGQPGVFVYVLGCPYCPDENESPVQPSGAPRCPCGNRLPQRKAGRPRKWCFSCRPSKWDAGNDEERERSRAAYRRWYSKHIKEKAA